MNQPRREHDQTPHSGCADDGQPWPSMRSRRVPAYRPGRAAALRLALRLALAWVARLTLGLLLGVTCLTASHAGTPDKFVMGTSADERLFTGLWTRLIYTEAFKRMDVPLEIVVAPLKRLEMLLARGEIDGEMMRGPVYATLHPELVAVDLPLMKVVYGFYALKAVPGLTTLNDLRGSRFRATYRHGVVYCENVLPPLLAANQLFKVKTVRQSVDMLAIGHADFFCDVNMGILDYEYGPARRPGQELRKLFDISHPVSNSAYLHPKHATFAATLSATLNKMKQEGLFETYRLETISRLQRLQRLQGR